MVDREEIIRFVEDRLGFTPTSKTRFWWDTGTAGLDVWEFMNEFADRYGVEIGAEGRVDYGGSDASLGEGLERIWKRLTFQPVPRTGHFTIDHLVEVANRKKWFDPAEYSIGS